MMRHRTLAALVLAALTAAAVDTATARLRAEPPPAPATLPPEPEPAALPNGLRFALTEEHTTPRVTVELVFGVGGQDDPRGHPMMARLMGELFADVATRHLSRSDRSALFLGLGIEPARIGVAAATEYTRLTLTDVPSGQLELYLWMLADRLGSWPDGVDAAAMGSARVAVDKAHADVMNKPYGAVHGLARAALYGPAHPLGRAEDGDAAALRDITVDEIHARARALYTPGNALLVVAGDFAPAAVKGWIARYFGALAAGPPAPAQPAPPPVVLTGERRLRVEADAPNARVLVMWPTAPMLHADDLALDVVARLLVGRITRRLVEEAKVAEKPWAGEESHPAGSLFTIGLTVAAGRSADDALRALDGELDRLRAADASPDEVRGAISERLTDVALWDDRPRDRARRTAMHWGLVRDASYLGLYFAAARAVTPTSLRATMLASLPPGKRMVAIVTPDPTAPKGGRVAGGS